MILKTPLQREREKRDVAIYTEYEKMAAVPGQSKTEVVSYIANKYGLHTRSAVYVIRKRVAERIQRGEAV